MSYFYLHPLKPQYFFPDGFKEHNVFLSFYQPYSPLGKISWYLFRRFGLLRRCLKRSNIEAYIPERKIRKIIGGDPLMAFNTGSPGPEQKITGLGLLRDNYFFIKYARTPLSIRNLQNEYHILKLLSGLDFVPQVQNFYKNKNEILLQTNVLKGNRLGNVKLNKQIISNLVKLSEISVEAINHYGNSDKMIFAHGDFCPWNMMKLNEEILVFDWEMAGNYPLGYDIFTFVFQTSFLLKPKKPIDLILEENKKMIAQYFEHFEVLDWKEYLIAFSKVKVDLEQKKGGGSLLNQYIMLLDYAKKA